MKRFTVEPARFWKHESGRTASIFGACPWASQSERGAWEMVTSGFTIRDTKRGTVGIGRAPFLTEAAAQEWIAKEEARLAEWEAWRLQSFPFTP